MIENLFKYGVPYAIMYKGDKNANQNSSNSVTKTYAQKLTELERIPVDLPNFSGKVSIISLVKLLLYITNELNGLKANKSGLKGYKEVLCGELEHEEETISNNPYESESFKILKMLLEEISEDPQAQTEQPSLPEAAHDPEEQNLGQANQED